MLLIEIEIQLVMSTAAYRNGLLKEIDVNCRKSLNMLFNGKRINGGGVYA